ncbi:MAG: hypothetical protein HZB29_01300 [Nitrospinae bacterium]|nr:hypothetical protein [Nitrospinota bacterium]
MKKDKQSPHSFYKTMANEAVALQILGIIEEGKDVSEKKITVRTGLAAGLVHSFMRRVINKGYVKAKQVSPRRWLYYLTPEGFLEKGRLTLRYFSATLENYKTAQGMIRANLAECLESNMTRIVVAGYNDLAEIAVMNLLAMDNLTLVAVVADEWEGMSVAGAPAQPFEAADSLEYDRIIVCDVKFLEWWRKMKKGSDSARLIYFNSPLSAM